jgi:FlaG/FlaF family flagellin (archaellin)
MSRTERHQARHLTAAEEPRHLTRSRWVAPAVVVGVLLLLLVLVVVVLATTRTTTPAPGTRSASVSQPTPASATQPVLSQDCRAVLAAAQRMTSHADAAVAQLRGHKQLMDDYKSGKIDRAAAFPQGSPWRQALARTLKDGVAAAAQYDADKAAYRKLAAQCSKGG